MRRFTRARAVKVNLQFRWNVVVLSVRDKKGFFVKESRDGSSYHMHK